MQLKDFATLADAQAYVLTTDKKQVGSGQARGFFVSTGIWTKLKVIQADMANSLFALADAVLVTASDASSYFGLDEATAEGQANIAGAETLVLAGVMSETEKDQFLDKRYTKTTPYANATQEDFDLAKTTGVTAGTSTYTAGDKLVTAGSRTFSMTASLAAPAVRDIKVTVKCNMSKGEGFPYYPASRVFVFTIPKGASGYIDSALPVQGLHRWVKFDVEVDIIGNACSVEFSTD